MILNINVITFYLQEETIVPFYANRSWYLFLRLHQVLCDRLQRMLKIARKIITDKLEEDRPSNESPAVRLAPRAPSKNFSL